jgi:hypothetical protein
MRPFRRFTDLSAGPYSTPTACPAVLIGPVPAGWGNSDQWSWRQDAYTQAFSRGPPPTNPQSSQTQLGPVRYSLVGS